MDNQPDTNCKLLLYENNGAIPAWKTVLTQFKPLLGNTELINSKYEKLLSDFNCIRDRDYLIFDTLEDKLEFIMTYS